MKGPLVPRRTLLLWGAAGLTAGCSVRLASSSPPVADRTPDDYAREAMLWATTGLAQDCHTLAGRPGTPGPTRTALDRAHGAFSAQVKALGAPPPDLTAPTRDPASLTGVSSQAHAGATDALGRVLDVTGPMARLLTSIAAGMTTQNDALAHALRRPTGAVPRVADAGTPALADPAFLALTQPEGGHQLFASPPGPPLTAALRALSVTLRTAEYGYGLISARLGAGQRVTAMTRGSLHRRAALSLDALAQSAGLTLPAAAPAYPVGPVNSAASARGLAGRLELACAEAAGRVLAVVSNDSPKIRAAAADHLVTSALGAAEWGARPALPGT